MKRYSINWFLLIVICVIGAGHHSVFAEFSSEIFANPPAKSSIHAWWHWMDNNITKAGIEKDLQSMKDAGIKTVTILNIGLLDEKEYGIPQVIFGTEAWFDMFTYALEKAKALDIKVGVHNCDGWSTSGGPWIKPEHSMKEIVWSKVQVKGGEEHTLLLSQPIRNMGYYQDVAVLAFPSNALQNSFQNTEKRIKLNNELVNSQLFDGNPTTMIHSKEGDVFTIDFEKPFKTDKLLIHPRRVFHWGEMRDISLSMKLLAFKNGREYTLVNEVLNLAINQNNLFAFPETECTHYQIELSSMKDGESFNSFGIAEIELLLDDEWPHYNPDYTYHCEKIVSVKARHIENLWSNGQVKEENILAKKDIIDLTRLMSHDGKLKWDPPKGHWTILRFGYTTTNVTNGPATKAGTGLECDKMDMDAVDIHFSHFPDQLIQHAGDHVGNTFEYLFIDSWECKYQNWTRKFPQLFESQRGYNITPYLPVLCGFVVGSTEETESFLYDYRKTIAELIENNYYRHITELCHRAGLQLKAEVIYGSTGYPPLDVLKTNGDVDVPMFEFWSGLDKSGFVKYHPADAAQVDFPMQAAALYQKEIVPAEAYTGFANYCETPWDLKLFGDQAFCTGVNQMVLHSYVHQPNDNDPIFTLGVFGQSFNRNNPWWNEMNTWSKYLARAQYLLQKGYRAADVLYFISDRSYKYPFNDEKYAHPAGISIQDCNADILLNHASVENGKIILSNGGTYDILVLPDDNRMELATLKAIVQLIEKGATVVGPKPVKTLSLKNNKKKDKALVKLTNRVWNDHNLSNKKEATFGKGKIIWDKSLSEVLTEMNIKPDFTSMGQNEFNLLYIHKKIQDKDLYFVVNQEDRAVNCELLFKVSSKQPEIWDPLYGTVYKPAIYHERDGQTHLPFQFAPREALFFYFDQPAAENHIIEVYEGDHRIFPAEGDVYIPKVTIENETVLIQSDNVCDYTYRFINNKKFNISSKANETYSLQNIDGTIQFIDNVAHPDPIPITQFKSWTEFEEPELKYHSGKAVYDLYFDLPGDLKVKDDDMLTLSLGNTQVGYEITLNGENMGSATFPNYRFKVPSRLKKKSNHLKVVVYNILKNRIIGDLKEFGELKHVHSTSGSLPDTTMGLQKSGIMGPVVLKKYVVVQKRMNLPGR